MKGRCLNRLTMGPYKRPQTRPLFPFQGSRKSQGTARDFWEKELPALKQTACTTCELLRNSPLPNRAPKKYRRTFWEEGAAGIRATGFARRANPCDICRAATWLRGQDSNLRPSGYEPDELPNCSTPRCGRFHRNAMLFYMIARLLSTVFAAFPKFVAQGPFFFLRQTRARRTRKIKYLTRSSFLL